MVEINISSFSGANNISEKFFTNKNGTVEPRIVLNSDVTLAGKIVKRQGITLFISLSGAYSAWAGFSCALCAARGILYRIHNTDLIPLTSLSGPDSPLSYVEINNKVYISNKYWTGVLDITTNIVSNFGINPPSGPMIISGSGSLPAGTYHVCMTNSNENELSGNGPISTIVLNDDSGIQVLNRSNTNLVWVTEANEPIFYLVGAVNQITNIPTIEPLPSFLCQPPPYLENLCYAFGRIWGSVDKILYYSQPHHISWFKPSSNKFILDDDITLIAKVPGGLYIGTRSSTKFFNGSIPEQMTQSNVGSASIPGTLVYCNNMPELSWTLGTPEKVFNDVPVWLTNDGLVIGNNSGKFFNISKNKTKMSIPTNGASLFRTVNGNIQILTNFKSGLTGSGTGSVDTETLNTFINGYINTYSKSDRQLGCRTGFTDIASCTVTRNGEVI